MRRGFLEDSSLSSWLSDDGFSVDRYAIFIGKKGHFLISPEHVCAVLQGVVVLGLNWVSVDSLGCTL